MAYVHAKDRAEHSVKTTTGSRHPTTSHRVGSEAVAAAVQVPARHTDDTAALTFYQRLHGSAQHTPAYADRPSLAQWGCCFLGTLNNVMVDLHPQLGLPGDGPICETRHRGFVRNIWILSILVAAKILKQRHARPSQRMHAPCPSTGNWQGRLNNGMHTDRRIGPPQFLFPSTNTASMYSIPSSASSCLKIYKPIRRMLLV